MINVDDFKEEKECIYKDEQYSVRDNGAVLRHTKNVNKPRPLDNTWTFGKPDTNNGYLYIAGVPIHRIVATAFYGNAPTTQHIVDHKDTNRHNNRPENLHWVTKLENVLNNPITRKKIILLCGSLEAFLENPAMLNDSQLDSNFSWMRRVSPEEAKISKEKLEEWAKNDNTVSGGKIGEWIYHKPTSLSEKMFGRKLPSEYYDDDKDGESEAEDEPDYIESLTVGAAQRNWMTPTEFLCVPKEVGTTPLDDYLKNLQIGKIFCRHKYGESEIVKYGMSKDKKSIIIQCHDAKNSTKNWFIVAITYENGLFIHTSEMSCFTDEGAEKYYTLALGEEWTGGDVFDDFC